MANRLADETSPYLLQHKDNPVDWYPWGEEALARASACAPHGCQSTGLCWCCRRYGEVSPASALAIGQT